MTVFRIAMYNGRYETTEDLIGNLRTTIRAIESVDPSVAPIPAYQRDMYYTHRNALVQLAIIQANIAGFHAGYGWHHGGEPGFRLVAYINLPTGQVAWHLPEYPGGWDGHTTRQKYRRIRTF